MVSNPIPRIGPDATIRCMNHPELTAVALQCASITGWSDAKNALVYSPLLRVAPIADFELPFLTRESPHAIFWDRLKDYFSGNSALGMCAECAYKFWQAMKIPPLYINQHAIFSSHVTIARTTVIMDVSPHTYQMMRIETPAGLANKVELVCPDCIENRYKSPILIELKEYAYE